MDAENEECGLSAKRCVPCKGGVEPLRGAELGAFCRQIDAAWEVREDKMLERSFIFRDFREALAFTNAVGKAAEEEGHHPEITLTWGRATVRLWTHKIGGLHENDFILAAKIDRLVP